MICISVFLVYGCKGSLAQQTLQYRKIGIRALQKVTFYALKGNLLQAERLPFASRKATFWKDKDDLKL